VSTAQAGSPATTRGLLRGNVLWLSLVSLLNDVSSEMIYPLLPIFLTVTLGADKRILGAIEGAAESLSSFLKLPSGWISDRFRRRPLVLIGYGFPAVLRPLLAVVTAPWHLLVLRLADRTGKGLRTAARDALLAESVERRQRGTAFGIHRAADHLGAAVGPLLASAVLLLLDNRIRMLFVVAAIPGIIGWIILTMKVREDRRPAGDSHAAAEAAPRTPLSSLGGPFLRYLGVLVLFTLGNATDAFLIVRAHEDLGVPLALLPLLWSVHHISKSSCSIGGGILADRWGARRAIVTGWLVYAATYAGFALASAPWHAWALFLFYGVFFGLTEAPEKALVANLAPADRRGAAFGAYHFAIGIAAFPASLIFGIIWELAGPATAFLTGAGLALLAALLLLLVLPRKQD
jgi:MFS family permease